MQWTHQKQLNKGPVLDLPGLSGVTETAEMCWNNQRGSAVQTNTRLIGLTVSMWGTAPFSFFLSWTDKHSAHTHTRIPSLKKKKDFVLELHKCDMRSTN